MAHVALTNSSIEALVPSDVWNDVDPPLRAARHARHLQDLPHAIELYLQVRMCDNQIIYSGSTTTTAEVCKSLSVRNIKSILVSTISSVGRVSAKPPG